MDTKSKNGVKEILIFIAAIYCSIICMVCIKDSIQHAKISKSYFSTGQFKNHIGETFDKLTAEVPSDKLDDGELIDAKISYQNELSEKEAEIENSYSYRITLAEESEDHTLFNTLRQERDKKLSDLRKSICKTDEQIRQYTINEKKRRYERDKQDIKKRNDLKYYIKNNSTGKIDTNLEEPSKLNTIISNAMYSIEFPEEDMENYYYSINEHYKRGNYNAYFIVPSNIKTNSIIYEEKKDYEFKRREFIGMGITSLIAVGICILLFIYIKKNWKIYRVKADFIYNNFIKMQIDVRILLGILMLPIVGYMIDKIHILGKCYSFECGIFNLVGIGILTICFIYYLCSIYDVKRLISDKEYLQTTKTKMILNKIRRYINEALLRKSILFKVIVFSVITTGVSVCILGMPVIGDGMIPIGLIYLVCYFFIVVPNVLKNIGKFNKIVDGTKNMAQGNLDFEIQMQDKGALGELASNINNIKEGYNKAVDEEIKSQKFKSELITNVSHDLKTPLTSIINYVKLLQQEGLSEDEIKGYIGVLDRKAERLKVLIEDLFEASKVSSGAVELNIERLDVVSLLKQALAEFHEKIEKSSLDFRVKLPDKAIYCKLDGKKTWRLFENLISNILKYSQDNTRVYIDVQEKDNKVIITMKNIASYEMNFEPNEIFERFKRGDESRTTEGSGLGLAIANSIAELQGGKLDINIDGDLFKSIVELDIID